MVVNEKTVKERLIDLVETMDEAQLLQMEKLLETFAKEERIKRQLEALRNVAGILSDPEEYAEFEKHARRRSLFGGRTLDLEPDEES